MKRINHILLPAMLLLASCQSDPIIDEASFAEAEFIAVTEGFEAETKTTLSSDGRVLWKSGDQLSIFTGFTLNKQYQVNDASDGKTTAGFSSVNSGSSDEFYAGSDIPANVAYYPYSPETEISRSGSEYALSVNLPSTQTYAESSFGSGAFPMVAVTSSTSDNHLKFKNVLGGIKLQLTGTSTVSRIEVCGNNGEILCGPATVTAGNGSLPSISLSDISSTVVTLDCGERGVPLDPDVPTSFIISLPPVVLDHGFTVTVYRDDDASVSYFSSKQQVIGRSLLLKMPSQDFYPIVCPPPPPIHYFRTLVDHQVDFCGDCVADSGNPQYRDNDYVADALTVTWPEFNTDVLDVLDLSYENFLEVYDINSLYVLEINRRYNGYNDTTFVDANQYTFPLGVTFYSEMSKAFPVSSDILSLYVDSEVEIPSENTIEFVYKAKNNASSTPDIGFKFSYSVLPCTGVRVSGIKLDRSSVTLPLGSSIALAASVAPENASDKRVIWSSSNLSVARVSSDGIVTALAPGSANVYATTFDGNYTASCKVIVSEYSKPIVSISYPEMNRTINIAQGESYTIHATVTPPDADEELVISPAINCPVMYSYYHESGSSTWDITVTAIATKTGRGALCIDSENYSTLCYINVYKIGVDALHLDESELTMRVGETKTMLAVVMPANASNKGITWTSSDPSVASVSQSGVVTAMKAGKVVITATSKDNSSARARCTVLIRENSVDGGTAEGVGFKEWN